MSKKILKHQLKKLKLLVESIFLVRDLINLPSNYIYPETLAKRASEILTPLGVKVTVFDENKCKKKDFLQAIQ